MSIVNATDADFQSLTESIYGSAGAAERMAAIKPITFFATPFSVPEKPRELTLARANRVFKRVKPF